MTQTLITKWANAVFKCVRSDNASRVSRGAREREGGLLMALRQDQGAILDAGLVSLDSLTHGFGR